jgi:two-component system sensor histidine kinase KdpD
VSERPGDRVVRRERTRTIEAIPARQDDGKLQRGLRARVEILPLAAEGQTLQTQLLGYGATVAALAFVTALLVPVRESVGLLNMALVYLVVVVGATVLAGRRAGVVASLVGFGLFNFFLVPPYYTFAVSDLQNILALLVFLGVSLLISALIGRAREEARQAQSRAEDVSRLYELSQAIVGAQRIDEVLPAITARVAEVFGAGACWVLLPNDRQQLAPAASAPDGARDPTRDELALASWVFWHGSAAEKGGSDTPRFTGQVAQSRSAFMPLRAAGRTIGVLGIADKAGERPFTAAERTVLATFADQAAVALERLRLLGEAQRAELLARTDELKSALMSAVSHDLRTPLASIIASVTSLLEPGIEWDEETKRDFLQGIYDEAKRLNRLVGNLLEMSRIEGGALKPEKDWYSLDEVIGTARERLQPLVGESHPIEVSIEPDLPLVLFDFVQIDEVLTNLIENAAKYTPAGTPIQVSARRQDEWVEVEVRDSGPGVSPEHLPHLFDKFYRVNRKNGAKGTGLGLAISKGLVEAHGGRIWARNVQGGGLAVRFSLPVGGVKRET